jgi:hypothetical protein
MAIEAVGSAATCSNLGFRAGVSRRVSHQFPAIRSKVPACRPRWRSSAASASRRAWHLASFSCRDRRGARMLPCPSGHLLHGRCAIKVGSGATHQPRYAGGAGNPAEAPATGADQESAVAGDFQRCQPLGATVHDRRPIKIADIRIIAAPRWRVTVEPGNAAPGGECVAAGGSSISVHEPSSEHPFVHDRDHSGNLISCGTEPVSLFRA